MKKMFGFFAIVFALVCGMIMGEAREAFAYDDYISDEEMEYCCEIIEEVCAFAYDNNVDGYVDDNSAVYKVFWRPVEGDEDAVYITAVGVYNGKLIVESGAYDRIVIVELTMEMLQGYISYLVDDVVF